VSEGEEHHVKNVGEIDEPHEPQLKFQYEFYLLNYTVIFFKPEKNLNCAFGFFLKT